ncbi:MAG: hypothetical protein KGZ65_00285 [Sphingomonadales bacterium]|nr:hypothetical protein [Sphingomonadaceae bacterium]MBS3929643.1 hypothetical protein [Sphingomonadales bacterium]
MIFLNPYRLTKRACLKGDVSEEKYRAQVIRANEIGTFDLDDIDEHGDLVLPPDEKEEPKPAIPKGFVEKRKLRPARKPSKA